MASLLNAILPSDDEEDADFVVEGRGASGKDGERTKRQRCTSTNEPAEKEEEHESESEKEDPAVRLAKKAKIDELWAKINQPICSPTGTPPPSLSLAPMCRPLRPEAIDPDQMWMRQLGISPQSKGAGPSSSLRIAGRDPQGSGPSSSPQDLTSVAAAALAAIKANNKQTTRKVKFAGKEVEVVESQPVPLPSSTPPPATAAPPASGLDAFLKEVEEKRKINVLDKSKSDWQQYKKQQVEVDEELEHYKKSGDKYLDKQEFLKQAELREYETERDKRLAADVRSRGRL